MRRRQQRDPAVGYNVYRSTGSGSYALAEHIGEYANNVHRHHRGERQHYNYEVTSVDASGVESAPSNVYTAAIP